MADEAEKLPAWLGWARLCVGLLQGLALYWCDLTKNALTPVHQGILFVCLFAPLLVVGGLAAMRAITLGVWTAVAAAILFALGWHDVARSTNAGATYAFSGAVFVAAVILFVGHHLVQAADNANKWLAPYEDYFDLGWRHGAQLALAALFTGAFWAVLGLGAVMFNLIHLDFLQRLIGYTWFSLPATCVMFAAAIHLTDLRSGLVRGVRALALLLLSWLLPIMTGLAAAFLIALCFTGLKPLWDTRAATSILLSAAGALVVLINATYQDGMKGAPPIALMAWSARLAGVLMTPLALLAVYALYLRVAQYGLTPERIFAIAVLLIGSCYAVTYLVAAFAKVWMKPLEVGNISSAYVVLAAAIALFTPLADPARLAVGDQLHRIRMGVIPVAKIDWTFLRFRSVRYGHDALIALRNDRATPAAQKLSALAQDALNRTNEYAPAAPANVAEITMHPAGAPQPQGLDLSQTPAGYACGENGCDGFWIDVDSDGRSDLVLIDKNADAVWVYANDPSNKWTPIAESFGYTASQTAKQGVAANQVRATPRRLRDLQIGSVTIPLQPHVQP